MHTPAAFSRCSTSCSLPSPPPTSTATYTVSTDAHRYPTVSPASCSQPCIEILNWYFGNRLLRERFLFPLRSPSLSLSVFKGDYRYVYSIPEFYLDISGSNLSSLHFDVPCFCILICFFLFRLNRAREKDLFLSNKIIHDVTTVARIVETDDELMTHPIWVNKLFTRCQSTCVDRIGGLIIIIIILL